MGQRRRVEHFHDEPIGVLRVVRSWRTKIRPRSAMQLFMWRMSPLRGPDHSPARRPDAISYLAMMELPIA
jgi:hypothetical protein